MQKKALFLLCIFLVIGSLSAQNDRANLVFFGSSVCRGSGAIDRAGYAFQFYHSGAIDTTRYAYFNASTGGDNTLKVEQLERLTKKLYPTNPDFVVIGLSLANEGIRTPQIDASRETVLEQFRSRLLALADSLHNQGIKPVIVNCYAHSYFYEPQYAYIKKMNRIINTWDYPSINVLGAIDDGEGRWVEGFAKDPGHPNTEGHREMYLAMVPSLFDAMVKGKKTPAYDWSKSFTTIDNPQKEEVISFDVEHTIHSFTMSFRFKAAANGVVARIETDQGSREVTVDDYNLSYENTTTTFPKHTGKWNHVVISHSYANQQTLFALNGKVIGTFKERLAPTKFVYGGNLEKVDLKDLTLHRSSLHEDEIIDLNNKLFIQSSLEAYTPMTRKITGETLPNKAQSLTNLRLGSTVKLKWVKKPLY